ncbi:hypothetical protein KDK_60320 [Dictyobacter kobayashii]|uniref:Uncharacterized protein n=1 Tax=Dictyobacter kobayashii TaxID=2014872 RepID=A0A402AT27_9CHLR|nr:hypothetical protein KDK_60320 [Dictyobacter kobayashii]
MYQVERWNYQQIFLVGGVVVVEEAVAAEGEIVAMEEGETKGAVG